MSSSHTICRSANTDILVPNIPKSCSQQKPTKGILKRASSQGTFTTEQLEERDRLFAFRRVQAFHNAEERCGTRIPKLSLTWSEKNAVAIFGDTTSDENTTENDESSTGNGSRSTTTVMPLGVLYSHSNNNNSDCVKQTEILSDDQSPEETGTDHLSHLEDEEQDEPSEGEEERSSSEGQQSHSHVVGKWWFGKSTRYVPHCAKKGCTHVHCSDGGKYLTPTQRRNKLIHHLKNQLKLAMNEIEEKDEHLNALREHMQELEKVVHNSKCLSDNQLLLRRERDLIEKHNREKQELIDKHEMRVRQLIKDAVEARSELMKIHAALIERNGSKNETVDIGIATDSTEDNLLHADIITRTKDFAVTSPSLSPKLEKPTITQLLPQEVFNQLKAYENEANVWRTKAAQLELLVKEQLMNGATLTELQRYKDECERLKLSLRELECSYKKTMEDSGIEANMSAIGTVEQRSTVDLGDRNQLFTAEITQLNERLKKKDSIIHEFEVTLEELKKKVAVAENKSQEADSIIETMSKKLVERDSEIKVANRSVTKLQDELEKKTKAICYLEERHQVYRNTILDNDLVVSDEATDDWRHGFSDPRYTVNVSRRVQTDLTYEDINKNEYEFISLNEKLKELERDFSKKQSSLRVRFKEIEDILMMKTKLVESLTRQLEDSNKSAIAMDKSRQEERHSFNEKLLKLAKVAERVPVLELEIERLKEEKSALELSLQSAKEEYDHGLEEALSGSLRKFQQQSKYWKQKIAAVHSDNCELKGRILALEKKLEENRLRSKVEKADLAQRLTSSIDHVTVLQNKINTSTCDAQVNVRPQMINKYVACRPNFRDKNTFIMKGELIDETEQQLICCQKELNSAQHQVELLQQELLSKATQLASQNPHVDVGCGTDEQSNTSSEKSESTQVQNASLIGKLKELEKRNTELTAKLEIFEVEKQNLKRLEGKRNAELVVDSKNETRKHETDVNEAQRNGDDREKMKQLLLALFSASPHTRKCSKPSRWISDPYLCIAEKGAACTLNNPVFEVAHEKQLESEHVNNRSSRENISQQIANDKECGRAEMAIEQGKFVKVSPAEHSSKRCRSNISRLEQTLQRYRIEKKNLLEKLDKTKRDLKDVRKELEVYRRKKREETVQSGGDGRLTRSRSFTESGRATVDLEEHLRWKEKAGVMFRELTHLREQQRNSDADRRKLQLELTMMRGEYELAQCQIELLSTANDWTHSANSPDSLVSERRSRERGVERRAAKERAKSETRLKTNTEKSAKIVDNTASWSLNNVASISEPDISAAVSASASGIHGGIERRRIMKETSKIRLNAFRANNERLNSLRDRRPLSEPNCHINELAELQSQITILLQENQNLTNKVNELENERKTMYLVMFKKGQESAHHEISEMAKAVDELSEDRIVLRFLHDALYHFLLKKGDTREHLQAMMTMLKFSSRQKEDVLMKRGCSH